MRTNLNEEIQKNLKLMGLINEAAASPSKGIFRLLFGSLLGPALDNAIAKIEAASGKQLAGKGIKAFEDAISAGYITRKQATKLIVQALIASGKSIDEIAADVTSKTPNFLKSVQNASKAGVDKAEVKAAVPELAELSDDLVDAILKKGGYEGIGTAMKDTNALLADFVAQFPDLFQKNPLWKKGEYKNAAIIAQLQKELNKRFAGKNKTAIAAEVKKMIEEAEKAIQKAPIPEEAKKVWYKQFATWSGNLAGDVIKAPISRDMVTGEVNMFKTTGKAVAGLLGLGLVIKVAGGLVSTGSPTASVVGTAKSEFDAAKKELKGPPTYEYEPAGFIQFLNDTEGKNDYGNKDLFTIFVDPNTRILEITGNKDKIVKKYRYLDDKKTYEKID